MSIVVLACLFEMLEEGEGVIQLVVEFGLHLQRNERTVVAVAPV